MHDENITRGVPAQRRAMRELAAAWILWACEAVFFTFGAASLDDAEFALFDSLVDADGDPHEQACIIYALDENVRRKGYLKPCPPLPTDARRGTAVVDAICEQLAQRQLWGQVIF